MTICFRYRSVHRSNGSEVKSPTIPITLGGAKSYKTYALVDSGADISAMSREFAEALGLDLRGKRSAAFGVGGKSEAVDTKMKILVSKGHESYSFSIPVKVLMNDSDFPILLGRVGFFDKFIISFDQSREKISLKRYAIC
ncbi:retropepsin-like aspartic protease [Nanoarchaeota archaeon]